MNFEKFEQLRESNRLEAKSALGGLPGDVWSSVSAFANTDGGTILLGVKENKKTRQLFPVKLANPQKMLEDFANASHSLDKLSCPIFADEQLRIETLGGEEVVVIEVPRVDRYHRPVYVGRDPFAGTYRRKVTGDYRCSREEVAAMLRDASTESPDLDLSEYSGVEDIDRDTLKTYRSLYNESHQNGIVRDMPDDEFLCQIGAARMMADGSSRLTLAGSLMFGQEWRIVYDFPNYFLDYRQQMGDNRRWEDRFTSQDPDWPGNVFGFYQRAYMKLKLALKVPFQLDGVRRVDETQAHEALREALVNALTNADYRASRGVVFRLTDEGIELKNPGVFRVGLEQARQGGTSDARNKTLLKMFTLIQLGERAGSGVPNMVGQWMSCGYGTPVLAENFDPEESVVFLPLVAEDDPSRGRDDSDHDPSRGYDKLDHNPSRGYDGSDSGGGYTFSSIARLLSALGDDELSTPDLMVRLGLSSRDKFRSNYLNPALEVGLIERTIPEKPRSKNQKYRKVCRNDRAE